MAGRTRRARWGVLVAVTGCAVFDPTQPIEIVPGAGLIENEVYALEVAGECWNLGFGTQFELVFEATSEQAVFVQYDSLTCIGAHAVFTPGVPARIDVCPDGQYQGHLDGLGMLAVTYFNTVMHELGHAAGIRAEGNGEYSVMGRNKQGYDTSVSGADVQAFSGEDYALFAAAQPDFVIERPCEVRLDFADKGCYCP